MGTSTMISVYSSSIVTRDISSASSGARRSVMSMPKALAISIDSLWEGLTRLIQVPDSSESISLNSVVVDKKTCFIIFSFPEFFAYRTIILQIRAFGAKVCRKICYNGEGL